MSIAYFPRRDFRNLTDLPPHVEIAADRNEVLLWLEAGQFETEEMACWFVANFAPRNDLTDKTRKEIAHYIGSHQKAWTDLVKSGSHAFLSPHLCQIFEEMEIRGHRLIDIIQPAFDITSTYDNIQQAFRAIGYGQHFSARNACSVVLRSMDAASRTPVTTRDLHRLNTFLDSFEQNQSKLLNDALFRYRRNGAIYIARVFVSLDTDARDELILAALHKCLGRSGTVEKYHTKQIRQILDRFLPEVAGQNDLSEPALPINHERCVVLEDWLRSRCPIQGLDVNTQAPVPLR